MNQTILKNVAKTMVTAVALLSFSTWEAAADNVAQPPSLKINGYAIFTTALAKQQRRDNGKGGPQPHMGIGASDLSFTAAGKAANGMEYQYMVNFQTYPGASPYVDQNYVQLRGDFGTVQGGNVDGVEGTMISDGASLIGGANGIDGSLNDVYNFSAGVIKGVDNIGDSGKSTKMAFYSPEVQGVQIGVSYTPNTGRFGDDKLQNNYGSSDSNTGNGSALYPIKGHTPYGLRNVAVGISFKKAIEKWNYGLSAAAITDKSYYAPSNGDQTRYTLNRTKAYQLGAVVGYERVQVGAGYLDNGKSRLPQNSEMKVNGISFGNTALGNAGKAWNLGASYTVGAYKFAAAYHRTDRKTDLTNKATSDIYTATVDVNALQGLKVFGEVDLISSKTNQAAVAVHQSLYDKDGKGAKAVPSNSAAVFILGTKVSF